MRHKKTAAILAGCALAATGSLAACGSPGTITSPPAASTSAPAAAAAPIVSVSNGSAGWIDSGNVYHPGKPPVSGLDSGADVAAVQATFTNNGTAPVTITSWDAGFLSRNGTVTGTETVTVGEIPLGPENATLNPGQSFTDTEALTDGGPWATPAERSVATAGLTVSNVQGQL